MLRIVILLLPLFITACAPMGQQKPLVEQDPADIFWQTRLAELEKITNWSVVGRAVVAEKRESWNVGLVWQQFDDSFQVKLQGPFSQGGAVLQGQKGQAKLIMDNGDVLSSTSPDILLKEVLNIPLPIEALRDWLRGMPYSKSSYESIVFDKKGRVTRLVQQGWTIDFKRYIPFEQYSMPAKVFIKKGDRRLRVVIRDWDRTSLEESKSWSIVE